MRVLWRLYRSDSWFKIVSWHFSECARRRSKLLPLRNPKNHNHSSCWNTSLRRVSKSFTDGGVGAAKIIAFLVNLRDELGITIVIAGTYKALRLLEGDLSISRRLVEGGYYDLKRPLAADDESFNQLCKIAWQYQWTRERSEIKDSIIDALYDVSQGITGIMLSVFASAQLAAIEDGSEKLMKRP